MNDRALRRVIVSADPEEKETAPNRETGFVITAASEIMAIVALASSRDDLRRRLNNRGGCSRAGPPVTATDGARPER